MTNGILIKKHGSAALVLQKCTFADCETIRCMQQTAFAPLLEKYRDAATNPACETAGRVREKMAQPQTTYYFICENETPAGAVRVFRVDASTARISPMLILPPFQNRGLAQAAIALLERHYPAVTTWQLDTILQEEKLCRLYEKCGFAQTGERYDIQDGMTIVFYEKVII